MNIYSLIGFLLATGVLGGGLFLSTNNVLIFVDYVSAFLVIGGTIAAISISFQLNKVFNLIKVFFSRVMKGGKLDHSLTITEIIQVSEKYRKGASPGQLAQETRDQFLKEALEMLEDGSYDIKTINSILKIRVTNIFSLYMEDTEKFKTMGKYPPAFGMMGTTMGMVVLLSNLGGPDAIEMIGPAMSVCLLTTLYGVIIANLIIIPVAENLEESSKEVHLKNKIVLEGFKLMVDKTSPALIAEKLNSFLKPGDRLDWKKVIGR